MASVTAKHEFIRTGNWPAKLVSRPWFWVLFLSFSFAYPIYRSLNRTLPGKLPIIAKVPEFKLTDENSKPFGSSELKGKFYLANFIFTRCPSVCPKMLEENQKIQKRIRGTGKKVKIVTFTVDPEFDTPQVLFEKARKLKASPYVWKFLTGSKDELLPLYRDGFKVPVEYPKEEVDIYDIAHSEKIVLVDDEGQIRGYYGYGKDDINKLMIDLGLLINRM